MSSTIKITGYEMFGVRVHFLDNMVRLRDVQQAYCAKTGSSNASCRISDWRRNDSVDQLVGALSDPSTGFYNSESAVINFPQGRRGGTYVCRELAHNYAAWLDPVYSAHILRAFDQASSGKLWEASITASKVATSFLEETYEARAIRLEAAGIPVERYTNCVLEKILKIVPEGYSAEFLHRILKESPTSAAVIHEIFCTAEVAAIQLEDMEAAIDAAVELYEGDPRMHTLKEYLQAFNETLVP